MFIEGTNIHHEALGSDAWKKYVVDWTLYDAYFEQHVRDWRVFMCKRNAFAARLALELRGDVL